MNEITFMIMGRVPSKKNSKQLIKSKGRTFLVSDSKYQKWEKDAKISLGTQKIFIGTHKFPIQKAHVTIEFIFPDRIRKDLSNSCEGIMDALVLAGIIPDDCWQHVPTLIIRAAGVDKAGARAVICITPIEEKV